ncbi:MAG TPA: hypothetical protein VKU00_11480 [Chthonomonadaceae bacterium]|nr:hypothetical protein [Chthonomonadaceae bacterium]
MSLWNWWSAARRKRLMERAERRAHANDFRAIGPLVEALEWPDVRKEAEEALIHLLPRMPAEDFQRLNSKQRLSLYRALCQKNDALTLAILDTPEIETRWEARTYLHNLRNSRPKTEAQRRIQQKAMECLRSYQERRNAETLMRPAMAPGIPLSTLRSAPHTGPEPHDA